MKCFYVPYAGEKPACVSINGHRLIILACEKDVLAEYLEFVGADKIREVSGGESTEEQEEVLGGLARSVNGGVVVAPSDTEVPELLNELREELPWLH